VFWAHIGGLPIEELVPWVVPISFTVLFAMARERIAHTVSRIRQQMKKR
jgi:hypothetical protein